MKRNISVLLTDDDPGLLETLADILEVSGFDVDIAAHGKDAEEKFRTRTYDVAAIDIMLPDINGVELVRKLKPAYPDARFIMMTAYPDTEFARNAEADTEVRVMHKPIDPDDLMAVIRELAGAGKD